jgi:hypothetical protein
VTEVENELEILMLSAERNSSHGEPYPLEIALKYRDERRAEAKRAAKLVRDGFVT